MEVTFREATAEDFDSVVSIIPHAWNGKDYLRDKYMEYMKDPDIKCFLCEQDGMTVAFHAAFLIDNGTRMFRFGARVKASHEGRGLFQALLHYMYGQYASYGQLKWESMAIVSNIDNYLHKHGYTKVLVKKKYEYKFPQNIDQFDVAGNVSLLTSDEMKDILLSEVLCQRLFPDGRIFIHCKPFMAIVENHRHFVKNTFIMTSMENDDQEVVRNLGENASASLEQLSNRGENSRNRDSQLQASLKSTCNDNENSKKLQTIENINFLTIGNYYQQETGLHYNMEVYGPNMSAFSNHLCHHVKYMRSLLDERNHCAELYVHVREDVDVMFIDEALKEYGAIRSTDYDACLKTYERPFSISLSEIQ